MHLAVVFRTVFIRLGGPQAATRTRCDALVDLMAAATSVAVSGRPEATACRSGAVSDALDRLSAAARCCSRCFSMSFSMSWSTVTARFSWCSCSAFSGSVGDVGDSIDEWDCRRIRAAGGGAATFPSLDEALLGARLT